MSSSLFAMLNHEEPPVDKLYKKVREGVYEPVNYTPPTKIDSNRVREIVERSSERTSVKNEHSENHENVAQSQ